MKENNYRVLKQKYPDAILLFRNGDNYETINKDAELTAQILGLTLRKPKGFKLIVAFPANCLESYLPKLVRAGHRVAVCDQLEKEKLPSIEPLREINSRQLENNFSLDGIPEQLISLYKKKRWLSNGGVITLEGHNKLFKPGI